MLVARRCLRLPTHVAAKTVHSTATCKSPRGGGSERRDADGYKDPGNDFYVDDMPEFEEDDATSGGHIVIRQKKQILKYMRLIERDGPRLQRLRKPFLPPSDELPLIVRAISYAGEEHPATRKQVIVVAISQLPLRSPEATHKIKLLAGARWSEKPPRDSGVGAKEHDSIGGLGYIKISCEDFPEPAMNLKWGSDVVDTLIAEANDTKESFTEISQDKRHLIMKARKQRTGEHLRSRPGHRPTIKDFPQDWLFEQQIPHSGT